MTAPYAPPVAVPANDAPGRKSGCWTERVYAAIPEDGRRYEVVDGVLYPTPAANLSRRSALLAIGTLLQLFA